MGPVAAKVLAYMEAQVGKAKYSKTYRMNEGYYDCSSLVYRAYKEGAGITLDCEHSTSTYEVYAKQFRLLWPARYEDIGKKFAPKNILQQLGVSGGEHVFYCMDTGTKRANKITHVATVRSGGRQIVHARNTKDNICYNDISYGNTRICAVVEYIEEEAPKVFIRRVLKRVIPNMSGADVRAVQQRLLELGYNIGPDGVDGKFGKDTRDAVIQFQKRYPECGTNGKPDGKVGPKTTRKLGFIWEG